MCASRCLGSHEYTGPISILAGSLPRTTRCRSAAPCGAFVFNQSGLLAIAVEGRVFLWKTCLEGLVSDEDVSVEGEAQLAPLHKARVCLCMPAICTASAWPAA